MLLLVGHQSTEK